MTPLLPLMIVPLLVWVAVWCYLTSLDAKLKRIDKELARRESDSATREGE